MNTAYILLVSTARVTFPSYLMSYWQQSAKDVILHIFFSLFLLLKLNKQLYILKIQLQFKKKNHLLGKTLTCPLKLKHLCQATPVPTD